MNNTSNKNIGQSILQSAQLMYNETNHMLLIRNIWNNFKTQPDIWFFYGFLATFTLSIRKIIVFYPIAGQFNEYSGIYLYLSDIFLLLAIVIWIFSIFRHKSLLLSMFSISHVPRGTILLFLLFILWSFISIIWSGNQNISTFRSFKLLEFVFLFAYMIIKIVPRGTILKNSLRIIITSAIIQSIIGICQFIAQHSIGFFWLKESLIRPDILGVAKIIINGEKYIRSYGLFPHPNIFGGFLFFSLILTYLYQKMFHVEQLNSNPDVKCSTWNNGSCEIYNPAKNVPRGTFSLNISWPFRFIFAIQLMALFLTFSKSAIIGLILSLAYIFIKTYVPRGTKFCDIFKIVPRLPAGRQGGTILSKKFLLFLFIFTTSIILFKPDTYSFFIKSLDERMIYTNVSRGTILDNPTIGLGMGQFVINMQKYSDLKLSFWEFQPVHNVFLLIWSELGIIGFVLFLLFLWKLFHVEHFSERINVKCSTWNIDTCEAYRPGKIVPRLPAGRQGGTIKDTLHSAIVTRGLLIGLIFIMLFDHYPWDIQQGQFIFWMTLAFLYFNREEVLS